MKKLILIDGNAMLHRAYHALPPLTDKEGEPVQAVYGFFSILLGLIADQNPEYLIVCFDRPKPTFRQQLYAGYHEHRPALAEDFVPQIVKVHEIVEQMKIPIFEMDGYEADDLIGTIASQSVKRKEKSEKDEIEVNIVSGDRDLLQLVNSHVKMLAPITGIKNLFVYDERAVEEKFGVKPSQFVDYKALIGDQSDGYPGVTGIGPKTAANLIKEFGTFENLYQHLGDVSPKTAEKLAKDAEQAALAKKLATIITDAPIQFDVKKCAVSDFDKTAAQQAFEKLGFKSLITRLSNGSAEVPKVSEVSKVSKGEKEKKNEQLGLL